ncbi:MAG: small subunit ribosomal protein [Blastocatellia bacterium]|jgi:small subunit ribosomal protein S17|nr:small subunit ribosomal protein [Blastocatellia bacterium]
MFRRKKKDEEVEPGSGAEGSVAEESPEAVAADEDSTSAVVAEASVGGEPAAVAAGEPALEVASAGNAPKSSARARGNRVQKVGIVSSDKMQKTVVVRVDRLVLHRKYRRYVRRTSKFMAHDDLGSTTGDRVRIVETRPLSARKRWRVVEIVQKAAK